MAPSVARGSDPSEVQEELGEEAPLNPRREWDQRRSSPSGPSDTFSLHPKGLTPPTGVGHSRNGEIMKNLFLAVLCLISVSSLFAATPDENEKYRINPTKDLSAKGGIYIPKDLDDCFRELHKMLHPRLIAEIRDSSEGDLAGYHFGLGLWMRNNWGLWGGLRLARYFNKAGIFHPDDMSGIILTSFWRHLNGKPIHLKEQVSPYQAYWKASAEPRILKCLKCGGEIKLEGSMGGRGATTRQIHLGTCQRCKRLWAFEYDKGWYLPSKQIAHDWRESMYGVR